MFNVLLCGAFVIMALLGGCARVKVEGSKEPIKVDITMRLDIYQHVAKDINDIEDIVSGSKETAKPKDKTSLLSCFIADAYAQEGLSPEVKDAALRRKDRKQELQSWEQKGKVGENKSGLVELRGEAQDQTLKDVVAQENSDRMIIYKALSQKNGASLDEVEQLYARRLQEDAPAGTPIERLNESSNQYEWVTKK